MDAIQDGLSKYDRATAKYRKFLAMLYEKHEYETDPDKREAIKRKINEIMQYMEHFANFIAEND